jgi:Cu2+-exporting ATPase
VAAGTVNYDGRLTVRATASGGDTAVADVVRLVEAAQARAAPIQRLADVVAGRFTYGVMGLAAATFVFWAGAGARLFPHVLAPYAASGASRAAATALLSLQLACNVLVVACPCALGLAAPTAVLVGTGAGARRGLLVRGGDVLEAASHVDTVVFDKTGTLTAGRPSVVRVSRTTLTPDGGGGGSGAAVGEGELLALAAAVERGSTHPIARAIAAAAARSGGGPGEGGGAAALEAAEGSFVQEPGSGVAASVGGRHVAVGSLEWISRQGAAQEARRAVASNGSGKISGGGGGVSAAALAAAAAEAAAQVASQPGHILVYVGLDGRVAGTVEIADELRPDAASTVMALAAAGIQSVMLSGDQEATAQAVGAAVGIPASRVFAGVNPAGKAALVERLRREGRRVAMVGDGVNDAAALAVADVGIAMGGGVDAASEVADIVLLGDRLPQVVDALRLSRATLRTIKQNMVWAFGYNAVCIPLAAGAALPGWGLALTPAVSGALMGASSLAVMANSLLLQYRAERGMMQQRPAPPGERPVAPRAAAPLPGGGGRPAVPA